MTPALLTTLRVLGWVLLHVIWQATLLGGLYRVGRMLLPRGVARYRLGMATLIAMAACLLLTTASLLVAGAAASSPEIQAMSAPIVVAQHLAASATATGWQARLNLLLPWLATTWLAGVLWLSVQSWRQWHRLQGWVRMAQPLVAWQAWMDQAVSRFGVRRRVGVVCCARIGTPVLLGWLRPVILLPLAVACDFPVAQIELILAHELAHVRRGDALANGFQVVLETLLYFHPVVRWVSREVRNEREICCDALALTVTGGSRREWATALAGMGELQQAGAQLLAANGGVLLDRVQQVIEPGRVRPGLHVSARALVLGVTVMLAALVWQQAQRWSDEVPASRWVGLATTLARWQVPAAATPFGNLIPRQLLPVRHVAVDMKSNQVAAALPGFALPMLALPVVTMPSVARKPVAAPSRQVDAVSVQPLQQLPAITASVPATGMPQVIEIRQPSYPQLALDHRIEGQVLLEFGLSADGHVQHVAVVRAEPAGVFEHAALQAMLGWRYAIAGAPVQGQRYRQAITFRLPTGDDAAAMTSRKATCRVATGSHICRLPSDLVPIQTQLPTPLSQR